MRVGGDDVVGSGRRTSNPSAALLLEPAQRIVDSLQRAELDSANSVAFEQAVRNAFDFLGFQARHVGGSGQTDVLVEAPAFAGAYSAIVDAKSSRHGRIGDGSVDWNSLDDHRRNAGADYALLLAPDFAGGNLLKRAEHFGVTLMRGAALAELVRLHAGTPFSLIELRRLFETSGTNDRAMDDLKLVSRTAATQWQLIGEVLDYFHHREFSDATNAWHALSYAKEVQGGQAPLLEAVEAAAALLSNRLLGILRQVNGGSGFHLSMRPDLALRRLRSLAAGAGGQSLAPSSLAVAERPTRRAPGAVTRARTRTTPVAPAGGLSSPLAALLDSLTRLGWKPAGGGGGRLLRLRRGKEVLGLAVRTSKFSPSAGGWWWTFREPGDRAQLADCSTIVLVGLMLDPARSETYQREVVLVPWETAVASVVGTKAWEEKHRIHVTVKPGTPRWTDWAVDPSGVSEALVASWSTHGREPT